MNRLQAISSLALAALPTDAPTLPTALDLRAYDSTCSVGDFKVAQKFGMSGDVSPTLTIFSASGAARVVRVPLLPLRMSPSGWLRRFVDLPIESPPPSTSSTRSVGSDRYGPRTPKITCPGIDFCGNVLVAVIADGNPTYLFQVNPVTLTSAVRVVDEIAHWISVVVFDGNEIRYLLHEESTLKSIPWTESDVV